jgi:hypothetical protein
MRNNHLRRRSISRRRRMLVFVVGAAVGSGLGLVLGSLLTAWLGEGTLRALQRSWRRLSGDDNRPNFDLLMQ